MEARRAYTNAGLKYLERTNIKDTIKEEVGELVEYLKCLYENKHTPHDVRHDVTYSVSRILYRMSYGDKPDQPAVAWLSKIVHSLPDYTTTIGSFSIFDLIPSLRHIYHDKFKKFVDFNICMSQFCRTEKLKHLESSNNNLSNTPKDLFEFFQNKLERLSDSDKKKFNLTDDMLYDGLEDIIRAGTESSSLIIQWFLLTFPPFQTSRPACGKSWTRSQ